jgi:hypothetical protein
VPFDIDQATQYLDAHAGKKTKERCAAYTANAISNPAGGGLPLATTKYAKNFGPLLEHAGFQPVTDGTVQKGDVAVVQPYPGGNQAGHMDMYDGSHWVSDFHQTGDTPYPGPGYRRNQPDYTIYRYKGGRQSNASGVQGITEKGSKLALGEQHGVALGSEKRHLSHQLADLEGGGKVTQGSPTVFVGRGLHPVARVTDGTTDGPIEVGENTVLVG